MPQHARTTRRGWSDDRVKRFLTLAAALAALSLAGCITVPPAYGPVAGDCAKQTADPATAQGPIYFVATGMPDCLADQPLAMSVGRGTLRPYGEAATTPIRYGIATPGTPKLPNLKLSADAAWHDRLRRDLQAAPGDKAGRILLYVHGYNNRVDEALSQADQIAMAARFDGPVVAFIWPSQHALAKYTWDAENAAWTQAYFDTALADLAGQSSELVLVAHSMGNRIAIDGLRHLQSISQKPGAPDLAARVKTLVLAAPDIDRELFDRDMAPDIVRQGRRIALFASGRDLALRSSWALHGNPRAGDVGCSFRLRRRTGPLVAAPRCYPDPRGGPGEMIVVDGSDLPGKPLGHSTHIDTPEGRAILRRLLTPGAAPLPAEKGVLTLKIDSPPDCASGPSRLGLEYVVARCEAKKK